MNLLESFEDIELISIYRSYVNQNVISIDVKSKDFSSARQIKFSQKSSSRIDVQCENLTSNRIVWKIEETGKLLDVFLKYFDYFMGNPAKIKEFSIVENCFDFIANVRIIFNEELPIYKHRSIKHLENLENLKLTYDLSDLGGFCDFQQICEIKKSVILRISKFSVNQIFQIKAKHIEISGLKWANPEINVFLKRCIQGEFEETVGNLRLDFESMLDEKKVLEGVKIFEKRNNYYIFEYANNKSRLSVTFYKKSNSLVVETRV
ncbi:unnamed protein product [Caenorhabditis angaria]|uniref:Sdz-33 F-box domain-containing protein n=1 Tax=Caenorhabditis angaria TaxID=860376 RepID=A0A9P1MXX4_9PELO|nr:unnamed protein product [Caenorhabditis angaria]